MHHTPASELQGHISPGARVLQLQDQEGSGKMPAAAFGRVQMQEQRDCERLVFGQEDQQLFQCKSGVAIRTDLITFVLN